MKKRSKSRISLKINFSRLRKTLPKLMKTIEMPIKNRERVLKKEYMKWRRKLLKPH